MIRNSVQRFSETIMLKQKDRAKEVIMEIAVFIGAFVLLVALFYGTLNWHFRDKRQDKITDQIVRDRYEHTRT